METKIVFTLKQNDEIKTPAMTSKSFIMSLDDYLKIMDTDIIYFEEFIEWLINDENIIPDIDVSTYNH